MIHSSVFLLCHDSTGTSLFTIWFVVSVLAPIVSFGFTVALIRFVKELRARK